MQFENKLLIILVLMIISFAVVRYAIKLKWNPQLLITENGGNIIVRNKKTNEQNLIDKTLQESDVKQFNKRHGKYQTTIKLKDINLYLAKNNYLIYENEELFKVLLSKATAMVGQFQFIKPTIEYVPMRRETPVNDETKLKMESYLRKAGTPVSFVVEQ